MGTSRSSRPPDRGGAGSRVAGAGERRSPIGLLLFAGACAVFVPVAWSSLTASEDWLLRIVPDDAFYYLQIARNLVRAGQSTADGLSPTNGYHPLWMAISVVLAWLFPASDLLLRSAVATSLALHVAVALALRASLARVTGSQWAWAAAACWLVNPLAYLIALQAVEATSYLLALLGLFALHLRLVAPAQPGRTHPSPGLLVAYGAALGVLCLARTDGAVVATVALCFLAARLPWSTGRARGSLAGLFASAGAAGAIVLPWLAFSLWQVGTIVQDSGAMKMLWASDLYPDLPGRLRNVIYTADYFVRRSVALMTLSTPVVAGAVAVFGAGVLALLFASPRTRRSIGARALAAVVATASAMGLVYGLVMTDRQIWWLALPCLSIFLAVFLATPALMAAFSASERVQAWTRVALVVAALVVFAHWYRGLAALYPWQADVRRSQIAAEALVPPPDRIGCFNAGIPMFFGSGRVVALDGLVSHRAREYWSERRFDAYLVEQRVRFIVDVQSALNRASRFSRAWPRVVERASFPLEGWQPPRRILWELDWSGTPTTARTGGQ
jgi:hypothetical protein